MTKEEVEKYLMEMPDEVLTHMQFSVPWQYDVAEGTYPDPDGFISAPSWSKEDQKTTRDKLQKECWNKFNRNPQINTATRGLVGRLTGWGFETSSEITEIDELIEEIELDPRNRLYNFWPKYVGRSMIEGELFLLLTCHFKDAFIEVDYIDPVLINDGGDDNSGIIFHPNKTLMPLLYILNDGEGEKMQIPSIFCAYYPELIEIAAKNKDFSRKLLKNSYSGRKIFKPFNGYFRFIVAWDRGFMTKRAISYMRTTLEWLNHYENLKKYEIDHKKSSGAYLWVFSFEEPRAFKAWLALSDEDRRKTGIGAKKTPGGSLVLPPGVTVSVQNPNLTRISEEDTDILDMIASGLNEPEDILMNRSRGTYASMKASRGPYNDRTSDDMAYFERFLQFDFWDAIFFLRSKMDSEFRYIHKVKEAVKFGEDGEPVFRNRKRKASQLIDVTFPTSESLDYESRARGLMGVKHGPITDSLGIPYSEAAKRMGFGSYGRQRLRFATEKEKYPELIYSVDAESLQESVEAEPSVAKRKASATETSKKEGEKK
jgi:hypothetical protein